MADRSSVMVTRSLYQIAIVTLLASLMWVGMGIYQATKADVEVGVEKEILTPVNPTIEIETATEWSQRDTQSVLEDVTIQEVQIATGSGESNR